MIAYRTEKSREMDRCETTGKAIYKTPEAAERAIKSLRRYKNERGLHKYRCEDYAHWHIGHASEAN